MMAYVDENGNITDTPPDPTKKKKEIKAENIELGVPTREHEAMSSIRTGKVEYFDDSKGYGFIKADDNGEKFFVHINSCNFDITENSKVSFETEKGPKGMVAVNVNKG